MKLLTYILIIVYPLTLLAHKASKEEIDKLKAQADSARQEYRTAKSKYEVVCRKKGKKRLLQADLEARKTWLKVCEQSADPDIVKAFEGLNDLRRKLEELRQNSEEYQAQKEAHDRYLTLQEAAGKDESTDLKVKEAYEEYKIALHRWQLIRDSTLKPEFWFEEYFIKACKKSDDSKVKEAYAKYQKERPQCSRLREDYIDAQVKLREALAAYNNKILPNKILPDEADKILKILAEDALSPSPAGSGAGSGAVQ